MNEIFQNLEEGIVQVYNNQIWKNEVFDRILESINV